MLYEYGGMKLLASQMCALPDGKVICCLLVFENKLSIIIMYWNTYPYAAF